MTIAYFLHIDGLAGQHDELHRWADNVFAPALCASGQAKRVEAYSPQNVVDPYLGSESGKLLIVQADFPTLEMLENAIANPAVAHALAVLPDKENFTITAEAFTTQHFPLLDGSTPERRAPISFVVRYYRPIENLQAFNDHYADHHPPIMANFPKIQNILCYFPVIWRDASSVAPSNSFLGNELVFETVDDLHQALSSDVRHDLRADYRLFPPHEGKNTHYAMSRRVLFSEPE